MKCPVCHITLIRCYSGKIRDGKYRNWTHGEIFQCECCGLQALDQQQGRQYYQEGQYQEAIGERVNGISDAQAHDKLVTGGYDSVLDVGAGNGEFLALCQGKDRLAVELDPQCLTLLKQQNFAVYNALEQVPNKRVDLITCFNVIEHVIDPIAFVKSMVMKLKKGGRLIISTPNTKQILMRFSPAFKSFYYRKQHNWYFTLFSLCSLLESVPLHVVSGTTRQRYGVNNFIGWIEGKPGQHTAHNADRAWAEQVQTLSWGDELIVQAEQ